MPRIEKNQQAILALPEAEYKLLRQWFSELDWEKWDREIETDSDAGKLDFLIAETLEEKEKAHLRTFKCIKRPRVFGNFFSSFPNLYKMLKDRILICSKLTLNTDLYISRKLESTGLRVSDKIKGHLQ